MKSAWRDVAEAAEARVFQLEALVARLEAENQCLHAEVKVLREIVAGGRRSA